MVKLYSSKKFVTVASQHISRIGCHFWVCKTNSNFFFLLRSYMDRRFILTINLSNLSIHFSFPFFVENFYLFS